MENKPNWGIIKFLLEQIYYNGSCSLNDLGSNYSQQEVLRYAQLLVNEYWVKGQVDVRLGVPEDFKLTDLYLCGLDVLGMLEHEPTWRKLEELSKQKTFMPLDLVQTVYSQEIKKEVYGGFFS
ncbi:MAG: hypothetical protein ABEK59_07620 [Halobacteria archaeon]